VAHSPERLKCKRRSHRFFLVVLIGFISGFIFPPWPVTAYDEKNDKKSRPPVEKVYITADRMVTLTENNQSEFIGNVEVVHGDTKIHADRIKAFYHSVHNHPDNGLIQTGTIRTIIANGNVRINFGDRVAESTKAEYITETGMLILSGPNSKVTHGNNSITGSKITLYKNQKRIQVNGGGRKRVKAILQNKGGSPDAEKK